MQAKRQCRRCKWLKVRGCRVTLSTAKKQCGLHGIQQFIRQFHAASRFWPSALRTAKNFAEPRRRYDLFYPHAQECSPLGKRVGLVQDRNNVFKIV